MATSEPFKSNERRPGDYADGKYYTFLHFFFIFVCADFLKAKNLLMNLKAKIKTLYSFSAL